MTLSNSLFMVLPSSRITLVRSCMEQYNPLALPTRSSHVGRFKNSHVILDETKERIRKLLRNVELSISAYDTAWVAMVLSPSTPESPCFPECLNWLIDNQLYDGSWGLLQNNPPFLKDTLSSTLASIVALKRWNVGEDQINKGLCFIESNIASARDKNQLSPIGFDIIFPGMLKYAIDLEINLCLNQTDLSFMLHERELELRRYDSKEREAYLAYVSEGLEDSYDWKMVMKYQMKNGSIFNSPSATAAALIHNQDVGCLDYLTSLVTKFGNAVPTVYPFDLYMRLSMVDTLKRLGIARHFRVDIQTVLDETYRCWKQKDDQIFMDVATCALAFRVLRTNGYQVSADPLAKISKERAYIEEPFKDEYAALEVYRASQITYQEELAFGEHSANFLKQKKFNATNKEVENALKFPFNAHFESMTIKRNIEYYNVDNTRILKTTYRSLNVGNEDYLGLAVEEFNSCQSIYQRELKVLERWVAENRLDKLKFARQKTTYCYFGAASSISIPELSDARVSWAKNSILTTVIDDFFDVGGSMDELVNLILCVEKWNVNVDTDCCSEDVSIIFLALKDVICWIGDTAFKWQERDVTSHVIETWLDLMKSMLREAVWARDGWVPTINEYIENGYVSFALGPIVLPALYFIGPKLSDEIVQSSEYHKLFKLLSTHGRLLNDIISYKRELKAGQLNAVTLHKNYGKSAIDEEEIVEEVKMLVNNAERKLLKLVMEEKGSIVPKVCRDPFWKFCSVINSTDDGFSGKDMLDVVKEMIYEPVSHPFLLINGTEEHS